MTDPERLLKGAATGDDADLEQRLLASIREVAVPPDARAKGWEAIAPHLGTAAASLAAAGAVRSMAEGAAGASRAAAPASGAPAAARSWISGLGHWMTGKVVVGLGAASAIVALGGVYVSRSVRGHASVPANVAAPATVARPEIPPHVPPPTGVTESPAVADSSTNRVAPAPHGQGRAAPLERLKAESALLASARSRLKSGNARGALATLERLDREFPGGMLGQEREVLTIQTLAALGDARGAERRARAFAKAHPDSPHVPLLRNLVGDR